MLFEPVSVAGANERNSLTTEVDCESAMINYDLGCVGVAKNVFIFDLLDQRGKFRFRIVKAAAEQVYLCWIDERLVALYIDDSIARKREFLNHLRASVRPAGMIGRCEANFSAEAFHVFRDAIVVCCYNDVAKGC